MATRATNANRWIKDVVRVPTILGGEPTLRGTRVPVRAVVLAQRLYPDRSRLRIAFPMLSPEAIEAALAFYAANRDEIEAYIAENEQQDEV